MAFVPYGDRSQAEIITMAREIVIADSLGQIFDDTRDAQNFIEVLWDLDGIDADLRMLALQTIDYFIDYLPCPSCGQMCDGSGDC